jgi:hypothetical protein
MARQVSDCVGERAWPKERKRQRGIWCAKEKNKKAYTATSLVWAC